VKINAFSRPVFYDVKRELRPGESIPFSIPPRLFFPLGLTVILKQKYRLLALLRLCRGDEVEAYHTKDERSITMKCTRCLSDIESHFRVYTDEFNILVCASCANEARRIGHPIELLDSKVGSLPAVIIGGRRILEKSAVQRLC